MRTLDIVHILTPSRAGGLERVVGMLAAGQAVRGHRVSALAIVAGSAPEPPLVKELADAGVEVTVLRPPARSYLAERSSVRMALAQKRRGVAHTHGYRADVLHASIAERLGFSTVTTLHGFTGGQFKNRLYEYVQRRSCRGFDRVVAVSRPIAELMKRIGVNPARVRVIPNAYSQSTLLVTATEARQRLGVEGGQFVIGWVGRLSREKGADILVQALATLRDLPIVAVIVGDGAEGDSLRAQARALGVDRMIRWAGAVDSAGSLFRGFDLLVLSSRTEGTPIVVFEAMAAGVPIVATAVGGIPDVLTNDESILVPSEAPDVLGAAIRLAVGDPEEAHVRARRAADVLRARFAVDPWLDRYESVYEEALESHPK